MEDASKPATARVKDLRAREEAAGIGGLKLYSTFTEQVKETKRALLEFLMDAKRAGKTIAGYGAPGKGNTLLNYCGIRTDFVDYTVDRNPYKHGSFLPGTHIPIHVPERIRETKPDYLVDPALESERRNHEAERVYSRVGRAIRGADSASEGVLVRRGGRL